MVSPALGLITFVGYVAFLAYGLCRASTRKHITKAAPLLLALLLQDAVALISGIPLLYTAIAIRADWTELPPVFYKNLLALGIGLNAVVTTWSNSWLLKKYRDTLVARFHLKPTAEVDHPLVERPRQQE
ncbi:unnamed protein product, partial [Mesorhabditis spiculigera]